MADARVLATPKDVESLIGTQYLREIFTRLPYCDGDCYADHCVGAILALENHATTTRAALAKSRD